MKTPQYDLNPESFPFTIEAIHPNTGEVVWSTVVEAPPRGERTGVYVPPLARQLGHKVKIRMKFPDGTMIER